MIVANLFAWMKYVALDAFLTNKYFEILFYFYCNWALMAFCLKCITLSILH